MRDTSLAARRAGPSWSGRVGELVARLRSGGEVAFGSLVDSYHGTQANHGLALLASEHVHIALGRFRDGQAGDVLRQPPWLAQIAQSDGQHGAGETAAVRPLR